ncbi:lipocalin family protein [Asticcacaulis sp. AC402]|uniref:lipocalin family protein n=1 Tax=Asticcacaulis sp. AC402 TaxID=1282361 RepID=UPI0003C3F294|nr:lipocalin family protein [Asticcacaulis sp. AC402]ESQ76669.1 hypothetical protein ABAC402_03060 [Asticcacaulis sp. AC402]
MASHDNKQRYRLAWTAALVAVAAVGLGVAAHAGMPIGNRNVPQPAKVVELNRYLGTWYEFGRYENLFEKNCDAVTAQYSLLDDGKIRVVNSCRRDGGKGETKVSEGKAIVQPDSGNAKLKLSFFGPFYFGDYWVLDHADDYNWAIAGEPSGKYLWILTREAVPSAELAAQLQSRAIELGYDASLIRLTRH